MFGNSGVKTRLEQVESRLAELEELAERMGEIQLAWADTLDRMNAIMHRLNARAKRAEDVPEKNGASRPMNPAAARILGLGG